jgi:hypothetical protein
MAKKKLKKFLKRALPLAALAAGATMLGRRRQNKTYLAEEGGDRSNMMSRPNMLDIAGAISKPRGTILPKKRRGTVLGKPGINRMDTSEVNMDYQAPDMSGYRNMDMGLEGYYRDGGKVVKTGEKTTKLKKKKSIQIKGFGKARR